MNDIAENALERALRLAATEPAQRPEFYKTLLDSTIYVIGEMQGGHGEGTRTVGEGEQMMLQSWTRPDGSQVLPFFSSEEVLQRSIDSQCRILGFTARALFEMTQGATLVLNPKSDHGKEFLPNEIAALLSGGVNQLPQKRVTPAQTQVLLGQPKVYPDAMVASLSKFLATRKSVKAAYLALMHDVSVDEKAHLIVGIQADGDVELLFREVGAVATDTAPGGQSVDLVRVVPGEGGLSEHFLKSVKPFYKRGWMSSLFSS